MVSMAQSASPEQRVGFFGGSFDPPHLGHLAVAHAAHSALGLDRVLFAPVGAQPLKPRGSTAPFEDRLAMTELAIAGEPAYETCLLDAPNPGGAPNYTLQTLRRLQSQVPVAALFCLVGADSFLTLRHWYGAAEVPFAASMVVASRPGQKLDNIAACLPAGLTIEPSQPPVASADPQVELLSYSLRNPQGHRTFLYILPGLDVGISATDIRAQMKTGRPADPTRPLIPPAVARYIREHGLYQ